MDNSEFDGLVALARSSSWEDRVRAARALPQVRSPAVTELLLALLCDPHDSAVTEAAVQAVMDRDDHWGADLILRALVHADEETSDDMLYFVAGLPWRQMAAFLTYADEQRGAGDDAVRAGAEEALAYFHR